MADAAAAGNWWDNWSYVNADMAFTDSEVARIPWARLAGRKAGPPAGNRRRLAGGRRPCDLCGGTYFGHDEGGGTGCSGERTCPRAYGETRRSVTWVDGLWVSVELLETILQERRTHSVPAPLIPPIRPVLKAPPPKPPPQGACGPQAPPPKAPPTASQLAEYAALVEASSPIISHSHRVSVRLSALGPPCGPQAPPPKAPHGPLPHGIRRIACFAIRVPLGAAASIPEEVEDEHQPQGACGPQAPPPKAPPTASRPEVTQDSQDVEEEPRQEGPAPHHPVTRDHPGPGSEDSDKVMEGSPQDPLGSQYTTGHEQVMLLDFV